LFTPGFNRPKWKRIPSLRAAETPRVTQEDRDRSSKWYPKVNWTDKKIEMAKGLGHL